VILADTSIWVNHLRGRDPTLAKMLDVGEILAHPFVIGELALGHLRPRSLILDNLRALPRANVASHEEVLDFIDRHQLFGSGIGYVDAHLLAATRLTADATLWTRDARLHGVAVRLGLAASLPA
jgi:predicted nucleic acid-binding protein